MESEESTLFQSEDSSFWDGVERLLKEGDRVQLEEYVHQNESVPTKAMAIIDFYMDKWEHPILAAMKPEDRKNVRIMAIRTTSMDPLAGKAYLERFLPDGADVLGLLLSGLHGADAVSNLVEYRVDGVRQIAVGTGDDSCETCKALDGKTFPIDDAPVLPIAGCTHPSGCRCAYMPA